jgi:hypothetical protein
MSAMVTNGVVREGTMSRRGIIWAQDYLYLSPEPS